MSEMKASLSITVNRLNSRLKNTSKLSRVGINMQVVALTVPVAALTTKSFRSGGNWSMNCWVGRSWKSLQIGTMLMWKGRERKISYSLEKETCRREVLMPRLNRIFSATDGMPNCEAEQLKTTASQPCAIFEMNCSSFKLLICCVRLCFDFQSCICIISSRSACFLSCWSSEHCALADSEASC